MTPPDPARAAVEAVAREWLEENISAINQRRIASLADCLLAFAAAQVREALREQERTSDEIVNDLTQAIRARREGPGELT